MPHPVVRGDGLVGRVDEEDLHRIRSGLGGRSSTPGEARDDRVNRLASRKRPETSPLSAVNRTTGRSLTGEADRSGARPSPRHAPRGTGAGIRKMRAAPNGLGLTAGENHVRIRLRLPRSKASEPDDQEVVTLTASRTNAGSMVTPKPGPDGTRTIPPSTFNDEVSLVTGMSALPLYSVNGTGFGMHEAKMRRVEVAQPRPRHVRRAEHPRLVRHPGDPHRADEAAVVVQVGLDDVHAPVGDHPAEPVLAELLLAPGDRDASGRRRPPWSPPGGRTRRAPRRRRSRAPPSAARSGSRSATS